jgi:predicted XRE-type DNA-binding protein
MKAAKTIVVRNMRDLEQALDLSPAQGAEIEVRSALCDKLITVATRERLTHAQIAQAAGASRTRVTAILNRNLHGVSTDLLLRILGSLGYRTRMTIVKAKPAA